MNSRGQKWARVLNENRGKPLKEIRAALRAAYPFGPREYHPYKIWCDEVRKQLSASQKPVVEEVDVSAMPLFQSPLGK